MAKNRNPDQLLLDLAQNEGSDVVHLPYSPEFEAVCRKINPKATTEDKHGIWEKLLGFGSIDSSPAESDDSATTQSKISVVSDQNLHLVTGGHREDLLFPIHDSIDELQPWSARQGLVLSPTQAERRQKLLASVANSLLGKTEEKVAYILQRFPETRDSDTALCIRYWKMFQADVLERWQPLELEVLFELDRVETLGRVRRMIQELGLFRGVEDNQRARNVRQREFYEYLAAHRDSLPEVRFYLDETGNEGDKTYTGLAGICVINWKQFEKHHAALEQWRAKQGWPETIHFADLGLEKVGRAVSLLQQLQKRRSGILFLGYSITSRGRTNEDIFTLFVQLVTDSLKHLKSLNCLPESRRIRIIKEAEPGFDNIYLRKMTTQLNDMVAMEFPGQLTVVPVEPVTKGRTVMLECADLLAGGMQRRALNKGSKPKDRLAEAVVNVTGFEDTSDTGAVFKYYPAT